MALQDYFEMSGYDVDVAESCAAASELLAGEPYDIVIADLRLSRSDDMDGLEVIRLARLQHPQVRTILLTATAPADVAEEARQYGIDALLQKPQPLKQLGALVRKLIG